jgi:septal ring factor EnvC (AmiA/AmiB activator)
LVKGREKTEDTFREKQGVLLEERDLLDQWREKVNRELMHRRGEIEKKEAEVHDIEREIDHRENMFRQQMEHENASTKREKIELKERQQMLIEQEEELKGQRLRIDLQFEEIDAERRRLQETAEQLSLLSANLAQKADAAERSLFRAEEMAKEAKDLKKQLESIQWEKMDLARQRVAFLKERSYSRSQHY